jgi:hypothetical protein
VASALATVMAAAVMSAALVTMFLITTTEADPLLRLLINPNPITIMEGNLEITRAPDDKEVF